MFPFCLTSEALVHPQIPQHTTVCAFDLMTGEEAGRCYLQFRLHSALKTL